MVIQLVDLVVVIVVLVIVRGCVVGAVSDGVVLFWSLSARDLCWGSPTATRERAVWDWLAAPDNPLAATY